MTAETFDLEADKDSYLLRFDMPVKGVAPSGVPQ
jgi:hypothetical protein